MKKYFAIILSIALLAALLAGCGSNGEPRSVSTNGSTSVEKVIGALFYIDFTICRSRI